MERRMSDSQRTIVPEIVFREGLTGLPDMDHLTSFLQDLSDEVELPGNGKCRVEILFTDNEEIRQLNSDYRNKDQVTDVLSFIDGDVLPETHEIFLGSVVVSVERAAVQAVEIGHSVEEELKFLVLHGILHLLGFDHENDDGQMVELQGKIKRTLSIHFGREE
jgi:probable rRNA maturation factor